MPEPTRRIQLARPELGEAEWLAVKGVVESGWVTQGPQVAAFEAQAAEVCGARHAVAVSSCTTALHLALICAGVEPGDDVVVPSMSFIATANAVVHAGARPVFAEVEPDTFNLDLADVEGRLTPRTKAILLVHQLGLPADIEAFQAFAAERGLSLIEDAACAIGSSYRGQPIGSHSPLVCLSFHPRKLVTTGDGGMILTSAEDHASRLRRLRQHGMSVSDLQRHRADALSDESYLEVGFNFRLTDLQAAVGRVQLARLPTMLRRRRELASVYDAALAGHAVIQAPVRSPDAEWNVQTYAVRLTGFDAARRDQVRRRLLEAGIATRRGVMTAHREPAYANLAVRLPVSEQASDCSLMLPMHTGLTDDDCGYVAARLIEAVQQAAS